MQIARWIHLLGVVVWIGGMFFAHMALRPAAQALAPPQRLPLLADALVRFLAWVAVAIVGLLAMVQVRKLVALNLILGLVTITVAVLGR